MPSKRRTTSDQIPKFFLTFAMKNFDQNKGNMYTGCPLDNGKISNGYINAEGTMSYGYGGSNDRKFKCFTLHPIIENKDITPYEYGNIGYDLNADSMNIYAGGWSDLRSNNNGNKIIANINTLDIDGKQGHLFLDKNGQVHIKMLNKVIKRAQLLKQYANNYNIGKNNNSIFENNSLETSFTYDNYHIEEGKSASSNQQNNNTNNHFIIKQKELNEQSNNEVQNFYKNYGLSPYECFKLTYNKDNNKFTLDSNELNGVARDADKGIKVDRIFVKKSILDINSGYWECYCQNNSKRAQQYDNYMKNIADVLIENFPDGEIRIIDGQNFEMMPTKTFIETYIPEEYRKDYLDKLNFKLKNIHSQQIHSDVDNIQQNQNHAEAQQNMISQEQSSGNSKYKTENKNNDSDDNDKNKQVDILQSSNCSYTYIRNIYSTSRELPCETKSSRNNISENGIISCLRSYCPCNTT